MKRSQAALPSQPAGQLAWLALLAFLLSASGCVTAPSASPSGADSAAFSGRSSGPYEIAFGLMDASSAGLLSVFDRVRVIPKYAEKDHLHGFVVQRKGGGQFLASYAVTFPEPLPKVSEGMRRYYDVSPDRRRIESPPEMVWDRYQASFSFEPSDPVGMYKLEIFIDGKKYQTIEYEVVEP